MAKTKVGKKKWKPVRIGPKQNIAYKNVNQLESILSGTTSHRTKIIVTKALNKVERGPKNR